MSQWILALAAALLGLSAPFLIFPEIIPASSRADIIVDLTWVAMAAACGLVWPWRRLRWAFWACAAAIVVSRYLTPVTDPSGLRHFAGLGLHLLAAAVCAAWCSTERRLVFAASGLTALTTAVVAVGLLSTPIQTAKLGSMDAPASGETQVLRPQFELDLPGMPTHGQVNSNALGGTALMVLPMAVGVLLAGWGLRTQQRWSLMVGVVATIVTAGTVVISLSRMAWLAAVLVAIVAGLTHRSTRAATAVTALVFAVVLGVAVTFSSALPGTVANVVASTEETATLRISIWEDALDRIAEAPWFGIGVNQFHKVPRTSARYDTTLVPHAHNIALQWLLDLGVVGLLAVGGLYAGLLLMAYRVAQTGGTLGAIAAGAGLAIVAVHAFGIGDAIAPGAKVGIIQWWWVGVVMAAARLSAGTPARNQTASPTIGV